MKQNKELGCSYPICPKTGVIFTGKDHVTGSIWRCPGSKNKNHQGGEIYSLLPSPYMKICYELIEMISEEAGTVFDQNTEFTLWKGSEHACCWLHDDGSYSIYVTTISDKEELLYELSHEICHMLWSRDWPNDSQAIHEMIAEVWSLWSLKQYGYNEFAQELEDIRCSDSENMTTEEFFSFPKGYNPNAEENVKAYYGRAMMQGLELVELIGWDDFICLPDYIDFDGNFDFDDWIKDYQLQSKKDAINKVMGRLVLIQNTSL
jgi:hypothetical protein